MTQMQLPAHLQNRQIKSLTDRAADGMGSSLPPHISIQGNSFTFVDAVGNEYAPVLTFDAAVIDVSDVMCKRYYDKPFDPNASTYEPPACWSANGIGPSREATKPQAARCDQCAMNDRGSAVSRISGKEIKACRDERWIALLHPQMPNMVFQLVVTPGSFKNWKGYTDTLKNFGKELSLGLTRFSFVPKKTGEILFEDAGWVEVATADAIEAAVREKKTDALVGRLDQPRGLGSIGVAGQIAQGHQGVQTLPPANQYQTVLAPEHPEQLGAQRVVAVQQPVQEVIPPNQGPFVLASAGAVGNQQMVQASPSPRIDPAQNASTATPSPSEPAPRRRRTKAEMEAAAQGSAPQQRPSFEPSTAPQHAPFPAGPAPIGTAQTEPAGGAPQFGMAPGAPMNPEMVAMLASLGFTKQG